MLVRKMAERVSGHIEVRVLPAARGRQDADSYRALLDSELDRSYRLAAAILRDKIEAEDAVHDAAVAAWRAWGSLRDADRAAAWFQRIVINTCRDRLRRRRRWSLFEGFQRADHHAASTADGTSALDVREDIRQAIERLSADERIAITLRYVEDMTVPAIAKVLSIPEGTIKSRLHKATRRLRAALGGSQ